MRKKLKVRYRKSYKQTINRKKDKRRGFRKSKINYGLKIRLIILVTLVFISLCLYGLTGIIKTSENKQVVVPKNFQEHNFLFPVEGTVTALDKDGSHENNGAVDISNVEGTPVLASKDGRVCFSDIKGTYGNCIIINHDHKFSTVYAHLEDIHVSENDEVKQGQVIGLLGNTGNSTGPHLHFEVRLDDKRQNLLYYFPFLDTNISIVREE